MQVREHVRRPLISQTFGRYIRLPENRAARLACLRLAKSSARRPNCAALTFLHGSPGSGKSHLVRVLVERIAIRQPNAGPRIVAARDLGKLLAGQMADEQNVAPAFRRADLLIVEDMQHLPTSAAAAMTALFDDRRSRDLPTMVTASAGPLGLPGLSTRLKSRLASGLVVRMKALGSSSLRQLARYWCSERGLRLDSDVFDWLIGRARSSPRSLFGDLTRVLHLSRERRLRLDVETLESRLNENTPPDCPVIESLADAVAAWFHLKADQLRSRDRRPSLLWPRQVAMYVVRRKTNLSLAAIGTFFGCCDHTTVLHALRKVDGHIARDPEFARELEELAS
jgi:chromosomal replication initiator protein